MIYLLDTNTCIGYLNGTAFVSFPFDDHAADEYGRLRAQLARQGTPIGPNDLMIASIALAHRTTLVTHNTHEFSRVPGLPIVDWEASG
jgi:tRNA(fMet)-specific endonuclease VapC